MDLEGGLKSLSKQSQGKQQHQGDESGAYSCSAGQSAFLRRAAPVMLITASLVSVAALSVLGLLHANSGGPYGAAGLYKRQVAGDDGTNSGSGDSDSGGQGAFVEDNLYLCVASSLWSACSRSDG